jgi:hypothetical protein
VSTLTDAAIAIDEIRRIRNGLKKHTSSALDGAAPEPVFNVPTARANSSFVLASNCKTSSALRSFSSRRSAALSGRCRKNSVQNPSGFSRPYSSSSSCLNRDWYRWMILGVKTSG